MSKKLSNIVIVVLLIASTLFGYLAYLEIKPLLNSDIQNNAIKDVAIKETENPFDRVIDFDAIKKVNKDIIGWIYIPGTLDRITELQNRNECKDLKVSKKNLDWVNSQIYTLSTCHGNIGTPYRLLISGVTTKEKYLVD